MTEILGIIATVLAIAGVVFNNRRSRLCFPLWIVSNTLTLIVHGRTGIWSLALRDLAFVGLAIEGLVRWSKQ